MTEIVAPVDAENPATAPADGFARFSASRNGTPAPDPVAATVEDPPASEGESAAVIPSDPPAPAIAAGSPPADAILDPETGEAIPNPTRNDRRIAKIWKREQEAKAEIARLAALLEQRNAAPPLVPDQTAGRPAAPAASSPDPLTLAAKARVRPEPNEAEIGTTYPTYEAFVKDCAIYGGELAVAKAAIMTDQQTRQTAAATAYQEQAKAYPDFAARLEASRTLKVGQAVMDALNNHPELSGHLNYWIMTHHDEVARISALPMGAALLEMGSVIGAVQSAVAKPAAGAPAKPSSRAPSPAPVIGRPNGQASTRLEDATNFHDWNTRREAQIATTRGRR